LTGKVEAVEVAAMLVYEQALELPSLEREAYIAGRQDVEEAVIHRALELLRSDPDALSDLRTGAAGAMLHDDDDSAPDIHGYRMIRQLGRGGMGAVWLAERATGDFDHRVAIKIIKPGVLSDQLVERFLRERQILAQLNHPNIARLYDGGETRDGQPYIVMEYVEGRTLREWLEQDDPPLAARLAMFRQIAAAVEFAHQNLIIHRDLTPNNVLVNREGQAKLIDFGIARPQVDDADAAAGSTFSGLSLTPGYAAPERSKGLASNTLSDIYSLGKILALMTAPYDSAELAAIAARGAAVEAGQRYQSAGEMIEDIDRYRGKFPVGAYSDARYYRLRKFIQREKGLVVSGAALLLVLAGGLGGTSWAYQRSEAARREADERFSELRDLANFQIFDLYDQLNHVVGNTAARVALTDKAQAYLVTLAESRTADRDLQFETASGFVRLALIQGVAAYPNFGEPELATQNLERAEATFRELSAAGMAKADTGLARALGYHALILAHADSKPKESREAIRQAEAFLARVPKDARDWDWMEARRVDRLAALEWADLEVDSEMITKYADLVEKEIGDWPEERQRGYEGRFDRALAENFRATVLYNTGDMGETRKAVQRYLAVDRMYDTLERDFPNDPLVLYRRAWNAYYGYAAAATVEDDVQADALLQQARRSVEHLQTIEENDNSLNTFSNHLREAQAEFFSNIGRFPEAIALQEGIIADREKVLGPDRKARSLSELAYGRAILGSIYRKAGNRAQACGNWEQAEALMTELKSKDELSGYIEEMHPGVTANLKRCHSGVPVTEMRPLSES